MWKDASSATGSGRRIEFRTFVGVDRFGLRSLPRHSLVWFYLLGLLTFALWSSSIPYDLVQSSDIGTGRMIYLELGLYLRNTTAPIYLGMNSQKVYRLGSLWIARQPPMCARPWSPGLWGSELRGTRPK